MTWAELSKQHRKIFVSLVYQKRIKAAWPILRFHPITILWLKVKAALLLARELDCKWTCKMIGHVRYVSPAFGVHCHRCGVYLQDFEEYMDDLLNKEPH